MTLTAVDSIHRGLVNLRANWELLCFQVLQVLIVSVLVVVGFLPPLAALGFTDLETFDPATQDWSSVVDSVAAWVARGREAWVLLVASLILTSAIWLMATLVYCYFQAGIFGVLVAGDRQAPPGRPRGRQWFRTFSAGSSFRGWAGRYLWRYFWLLNLFMLISTVWLVLPLLLLLLTVWGDSRWGTSAALGIGCGGAIPVVFSLIVLAFWSQLAQADLAREASGVWIATGRGLQILGRRLGAVIVLGLAPGGYHDHLDRLGSRAFDLSRFLLGIPAPPQNGPGHVVLTLVEWGSSSLISVAFAAILVSLVRGEVLASNLDHEELSHSAADCVAAIEPGKSGSSPGCNNRTQSFACGSGYRSAVDLGPLEFAATGRGVLRDGGSPTLLDDDRAGCRDSHASGLQVAGGSVEGPGPGTWFGRSAAAIRRVSRRMQCSTPEADLYKVRLGSYRYPRGGGAGAAPSRHRGF